MNIHGLQFKIAAMVVGALGAALAVAIYSLATVYGSIQDLDRISREDFDTQRAILQATAQFKVQVQEWKNVLLRGKDPAALERYWSGFEKAEKAAADAVREARVASPKGEVRERLEKFLAEHQAAGEKYRAGLAAFKAAGFDPAAGDRAVAGVDRGPTDTLAAAEKSAGDLGAKAVAEAVSRAEFAYRLAIVLVVAVAIAASAAVWLYVRRAVVAPIASAVGFAQRIARGDLTAEIHSASRDEAGELLRALAHMSRELSDVVARVRGAAESVVTGARQVAVGTTDLSQRTEEQASSLEETAASMEELASTVKQNAENAQRADGLARTASQRAEQGGSEVVRVVVNMSGLSESAAKIADIISVIDGIAFQTNILALNAAVEAARAGEQGRGFAVVASEVRALAQRSAQAAKEIKTLIDDSVRQVKDGTELVEKAGETIQALVIDVKQVSDLMRSIAEASAEQSRGVQQVNRTVTEMDKVVQQNASVVQESTAAAESMRQQAASLMQAVGAFRIERALGTEAAPGALAGKAPLAPALARRAAAAAAAVPAVAGAADDEWEQF